MSAFKFTATVAGFSSLRRMVSCVRVLGIRSGWKYWRIGERARKYPALVAQWADNCRHEADVCDAEELSKALRGWADELDRHYARWSSEQAANAEVSDPTKEGSQH